MNVLKEQMIVKNSAITQLVVILVTVQLLELVIDSIMMVLLVKVSCRPD